MIDKEPLLAQSFTFWSHLSKEEKASILKNSIEVNYEKGAMIHRSDVGCKGAILLLSGTMRVYIISEEGREVTLFRIHQGESCVLSASCLLDSIQFDLLIEAAESVHAIMIPTNILHPIMEKNPYVGLYMYKMATERFSDVMWTMQQILFMGADRRVAIFLWDEFIQKKKTVLNLTHDEIARYIGSAREVVSKVMKYFSEEGIVTLGRGKITLLDKEKLQTYL